MAGFDPYGVLHLARDASEQEVEARYLDLLAIWSPDHFSHNPRLRQFVHEQRTALDVAFAQAREAAAGHGVARLHWRRYRGILVALAALLVLILWWNRYEPIGGELVIDHWRGAVCRWVGDTKLLCSR